MNAEKPHLLVVDDEPLNRVLLRRLLSNEYEISAAEDADEALSLLQSEAGASIVLVLSDHLMPGKTGVELATLAREHRSDLPFLLLTGYDQEREVVDAKRDGTIADVLGKPWRTRELRELIARTLR